MTQIENRSSRREIRLNDVFHDFRELNRVSGYNQNSKIEPTNSLQDKIVGMKPEEAASYFKHQQQSAKRI
jgi:hypothetical protein